MAIRTPGTPWGTTESPLISVVVPSKGVRPDSLIACLRSIEAQNVPHESLLVVPPGSSVPDEARELSRVIVHPGSISVAVNAGIRTARGSIIALTHDDCLPSEGWLAELAKPLVENRAAVCVGQTVPSREGRAYPTTRVLHHEEPKFVSGPPPLPVYSLDLVGNNVAVRREAILGLGLFDEAMGAGSRLKGGEDLDLFHRALDAGHVLCINPRAVVYHEPLDTWEQELRMMYNYRVGLAAYYVRHSLDPEVSEFFLRNVFVDQVRQTWRSFRNGRLERLAIEAAALLGLQIGTVRSLARGLRGKPTAPGD